MNEVSADSELEHCWTVTFLWLLPLLDITLNSYNFLTLAKANKSYLNSEPVTVQESADSGKAQTLDVSKMWLQLGYKPFGYGFALSLVGSFRPGDRLKFFLFTRDWIFSRFFSENYFVPESRPTGHYWVKIAKKNIFTNQLYLVQNC